VIIPLVSADQPVPFAPLGNTTGSYELYQGNDFWEVNTNIPLSQQDVCYPEVLFYLIVLIGVLFLAISAVFIARFDSMTWIAMMFCGAIAMGVEYAAAEMSSLVGYSKVFSQVIATVGSNGAVTLNATNTIYVNHIIVYTIPQSFAYACWGLGTAGLLVFFAGFLLMFSWAKRRFGKKPKKGSAMEGAAFGKDNDAIMADDDEVPYRTGVGRS
jgi:hypothetical protein